MKKMKLNITLLKNGLDINKPEEFIDNYSSNEIFYDKKDTLKLFIYKKIGSSNKPDWLKFLEKELIAEPLSNEFPNNQTSGATLFISINDRIFAITFGLLGRFIISKNSIDKKFGIYTVNKILNEYKNAKIKSIHSRVNETNPVNKQHRYGVAISNNQLFLTMDDNEALRELTIFNHCSNDFSTMIGKYSSLIVQFLFEKKETPFLKHLPLKLEKLLDIYLSVTKEDTKKLFKGLYPVDDNKAESLHAELSNKLTQASNSFFLFEPEINFDINNISKFRFLVSDKTREVDELSLLSYLELRSCPSKQDLENDKIHILDEDGKKIRSWNILECLCGEIEYKKKHYILSYSDWYEISSDRYKMITARVESVLDNNFTVSDEVKTKTKQHIKKLKTRTKKLIKKIFLTLI